MALIEAFTRNPVKVAVGVLLTVLFGLVALLRMPVQLTPEVETPIISIETSWPGASPEEVEREIVQEQEEQLQSVEGVTKMTSECGDSQGYITLEFQVGTDLSQALVRVNSRLQQVAEYPADAKEPVITTASSSAFTFIALFVLRARTPSHEQIAAFLAREENCDLREALRPVHAAQNSQLAAYRLRNLVGQRPEIERRVQELLPPKIEIHAFREFAEDMIEARFERVPGVGSSNVFGGREQEMRVVMDAQRLSAHGLIIADVRRALREQNRDVSAGDLASGHRRYIIRTLSRFRSEEDVANVIVGCGRDGAPTYLRDVAEVRLGYKKPTYAVRNFAEPCLTVGVHRQTGANVLDTTARIREIAAELNRGLLHARGLELVSMWDESEYIYSALWLVNQDIIVGGLLTVAALLLFLRNWRTTIVIGLTIPISIMGAFLLLHLMGRSMNVVSLAGLTFAVGMFVDNGIVVLENVFRRNELGEEPFRAAVRGTHEVWGAVLASTLANLAVFLPVLFVQEEAGQLFRDIALAISAALSLSLLVSVAMVPTAAARLLRRAGGPLAPAAPRRRAVWLAPLDRFAAGFVGTVLSVNAFVLRSAVRRLATVLLLIGASVGLSWFLMPKVEYLPSGNRNQVIGQVAPPPGYNLDRMLQIGQKMEDDTRPYWDIDRGAPNSNRLDYPAVGNYTVLATTDRVYFVMRAVDPMRIGELVPLVQKLGAQFPGALAFATQTSLFSPGLSGGRSVDIEITGPDLSKLAALARGVFEQVPRVVPGSRAFPHPSLELSSPQVHIVPRRERSAQMQIGAAELGYALDALVDGAYAADYYVGGKKIDLTIAAGAASAGRMQDLPGLPVQTASGKLARLDGLANINFAGSAEAIFRRERQRALAISVAPPDEMPLEQAMELIESRIVAPLRQSGQIGGAYEIRLSGTADKLQAAWQALRWNLVLAAVITYLLMAALFESWLYPLVIILSVPLGMVGGFVGLWLLNVYLGLLPHAAVQSLDVVTMLGFVILVGTVVNNPILIVHQSLNHMREGMPMREAILESTRTRIRPIFMTTSITVVGLLPLVLVPGEGSELYRGLGAVVLGGLLVSTLFTLVLVPAVFSLALEAKAALLRRLGWSGAGS